MSQNRLCQTCGTGGVRSGRRYCSISCFRTSNPRQMYSCKNCASETKNKYYCSRQCRSDFAYEERRCNWCDSLFKSNRQSSLRSCSRSCAAYARWTNCSAPTYTHEARQNATNIYNRVPSVDETKHIIWIRQKKRCMICSDHLTSHNVGFLDHNHDTDAIRGLLCSTCNSGLGFFRDSAEIVSSALEYLRTTHG